MPRTSKQRLGFAVEDVYSVQMTEELADLAARLSESHKTNKAPTYQSSISLSRDFAFGTASERGGCSCAICLRNSGPDVSELQETVEEISEILVGNGEDVASANGEADHTSGSLGKTQTDVIPQTSQQLAKQLCQCALEQPDPSRLNQLLAGINSNTAADIAVTLALPVAQRGHANIISTLAASGTDFSTEDYHRGGPPLMHAANNGHTATVSELLKCGADIHATDRLGQTALMVAVFSDRDQTAEVLIKEGQADLEAEDHVGRTALSHAAKYGSVNCINLLANCHADVFHKDHDGKTPVQIAEAVRNPRPEVISKLKRYQQLQTIRLRCERKKLKEAAQPSQLSPEDQAEAQAKSDAIAEALLAQEAAEKEQALVLKVKKKSKPKEASGTQLSNGTHSPTDSASQPTEPGTLAAAAEESVAESTHNNTGNPKSDQCSVLQPALGADAICTISTVQSKPHDSQHDAHPVQETALDKHPEQDIAPDKHPEQEIALDKHSPDVTYIAPSVSAHPPSDPSQTPVEHSTSPPPPSVNKSPADMSAQAEQPVPAPAATHKAAVPASEPSSTDAATVHTAAASAPSSQGPSRGPPAARRPHTASSQQAFSSHLKAALGPTARKVHLPAKPVPRSKLAAATAPSEQSTASDQIQTASEEATALSEMTASGPDHNGLDTNPSDVSAGDHHGANAVAEADNAQATVSVPQSPDAPADTQAPPSTEAASETSSQFDFAVDSSKLASAAYAASDSDSLSSSHAQIPENLAPVPVRTDLRSPSTHPEHPELGSEASESDAAEASSAPVSDYDTFDEQTSPLASALVRKPPGLPSPVPSTRAYTEKESAPVDGPSSWDVQDQSEASSVSHSSVQADHNPVKADHSPVKAEDSSVKADEASTTTSSQGIPEVVSLADQFKREQRTLEQKLRDDLQRIKGNGQPIDSTDSALKQRLGREAEQQFAQELKHLKGKMRAAEKAAALKAERERAQQIQQEAQHAKRREAWLAAGKNIPGPVVHPQPSLDPYSSYPRSNAASSDGGYNIEDARPHAQHAPKHAPKAYPAPGVRHVPAQAAPGWLPLEQRLGPNAAMHEGPVSSRAPRGQAPFTQAPTQDRASRPFAPPAANPLAFLGQVAPVVAPKANPDPLAFGLGLASGAVYKQQMERLSGLIEASKARPYQEQERLWRELQTLVNKASRDRCPLPQADDLLQDLKSSQDTRDMLQQALNAQPVSISTLEHAIQAGRNCRLLNKDLVKDADTKLRELKRNQQADPRQHFAPPPAPQARSAYAAPPPAPTPKAGPPQQPPRHIPVPQYVPQPAPRPQFVPRPYAPHEPQAAARYVPAPAVLQQRAPKQQYMPAQPGPQQRPARQEHMPAQPGPQQRPPRQEHMHAQPRQEHMLAQPGPHQRGPRPEFVPAQPWQDHMPAQPRQDHVPAQSGPQQRAPRQEHMPAQPGPQQRAPRQDHVHAQPGLQQTAAPQYQPQPLAAQHNVPRQFNPQQNVPQQQSVPQYKPQQPPATQKPSPYLPQQAAAQQNIPPQHVPLQLVAAPAVQQPAPLAAVDAAQTKRQQSSEGAVARGAATSTAAPSTAVPSSHPRQSAPSTKGPPPGMPVRKGPQMAPPSDAARAAAAALDNLEPALARAENAVSTSVKPQPQTAAAGRAAGQDGKQDECVVCWAHEKDVVCIPCGHVAMCKGCSQAVLKKNGLCPVCRSKIREVFQLYRT